MSLRITRATCSRPHISVHLRGRVYFGHKCPHTYSYGGMRRPLEDSTKVRGPKLISLIAYSSGYQSPISTGGVLVATPVVAYVLMASAAGYWQDSRCDADDQGQGTSDPACSVYPVRRSPPTSILQSDFACPYARFVNTAKSSTN